MTAIDDAAELPDEVVELTGQEGGVWHIHTEHSMHRMHRMHRIDLDAGTVERRAGPQARKLADQVRPLREIELCQVGEYGSWTMWSTDQHFDFYRYSATLVQRIVRATSKHDNPEEADVHDAAAIQASDASDDDDLQKFYRRLRPWVTCQGR